MGAAGKVIAASAILLIAALGLFAWMRRTPAAAPAGGAPVTREVSSPSVAVPGTSGSLPPAATPTGTTASGDAKLPPGTTIGPNGVVFHNPAISDKPPVPAQKLNVPKPVIPHTSKPNPEAVRLKLHPER